MNSLKKFIQKIRETDPKTLRAILIVSLVLILTLLVYLTDIGNIKKVEAPPIFTDSTVNQPTFSLVEIIPPETQRYEVSNTETLFFVFDKNIVVDTADIEITPAIIYKTYQLDGELNTLAIKPWGSFWTPYETHTIKIKSLQSVDGAILDKEVVHRYQNNPPDVSNVPAPF